MTRRLDAARLALALAALAPTMARSEHWLHADTDEMAVRIGFGDTTSAGIRRVAAGDLDGDGRDELIHGSSGLRAPCDGGRYEAGAILVMRPRATWPADGQAQALASTAVCGPAVGAALDLVGVGDVTGDGLDDIVARTSSAAYVLFGRSSWPATIDLATEAADVTIRPLPAFSAVQLVEIDGDGVLDVLLAGTTGLVWRGGTSWPVAIDPAVDAPDVLVRSLGGAQRVVAIGDMSGDGQPDLLLRNSSPTPRLVAWLASGAWPGTIDLASEPLAVWESPSSVASGSFADVNGDAVPDLLLDDVHSAFVPSRLRAFDGAAAMIAAAPMLTVTAPVAERRTLAAALDADGDGMTDFAFAGGGGTRGRNSGTSLQVKFAPLAEVIDLGIDPPQLSVLRGLRSPTVTSQVATLDMDADGSLDVVTVAAGSIVVVGSPRRAPEAPLGDLFVDSTGGDDASSGASWATALRTINRALTLADAAMGDLTIHVAPGDHRAESIRIGGGTTLLGGELPGGGGRGGPGSARPVLRAPVLASPWMDRPAVIDGFRMRDGVAAIGAGATVASGRGVLRHCVVTRNEVYMETGQIQTTCVDPLTGFSDYYVWCYATCTGNGTGLLVGRGARAEIESSLFHSNEVRPSGFLDFDGDGLQENWGNWYCADDTWVRCPEQAPHDLACTPSERGGAVYVQDGGSVSIRSATIASNDGDGVFLESADAETQIVDSILWGNRTVARRAYDLRIERVDGQGPSIHHGIIGETNVPASPTVGDSEPFFADASEGDFRLLQATAGQVQDSPARDAGSRRAADACESGTCLGTLSTRTDGAPDVGTLDLGFHDLFQPEQPPAFAGIASAVQVGECAVEISWAAAADPNGDAGIVYRVLAGPEGAMAVVATLDSRTRSYLHAARWQADDLWFSVVAEDTAGLTAGEAAALPLRLTDETPPRVSSATATPRAPCDVRVSLGLEGSCAPASAADFHRSAMPGFVPDATTLVGTLAADGLGRLAPFNDVVPGNGTWYYRSLLRDAAGNETLSPQAVARVATCDATITPPAPLATPFRLARTPAGIEARLASAAPGATSHRLMRGLLASLSSGYSHLASVGPDGVAGGDDVGACSFDGLTALDPTGLEWTSDAYYLVAGLNDAGEGPALLDSFGRAAPAPAPGSECP